MINKFSVIITSYLDEKPEYFQAALHSIIHQTKKPSEIVILFDGPVQKEQVQIANEMRAQNPDILFKIIDLNINVGRGNARNIAIQNTSNNLVAIMDSDDISTKDRFEKQLAIFNNTEVDIVASWQEEFDEKDNRMIKTCPEFDKDIKNSLKFRCLIPNPSIMFKKDCFEQVGGYGTNKLLGEDHIFFVKLAISDVVFYCIQEPLIKVRINHEQRKRRGGFVAIKDDLKLRNFLLNTGYINLFEYFIAFSVFSIFRLLPIYIKDKLFKHILRKQK
jgi:glycosyltransferase involved in cell wall biosynthesis